jgi:crotonobetainyl-CoA:carnitine CoA-transferase CaiB-like acyl-CoA transferase
VASDGEWQALRQYLALPDDPRHRTLAGRQADRLALDAAIAAATASHDATALGEALRARGVPAFRSASSMDLCSDDWLWTRGTFRMVSDHAQGSRPVIAPSWRMPPDEAELARGAPFLGQHNDYVYRTLLGLSAERLDDLVRRKVIE